MIILCSIGIFRIQRIENTLITSIDFIVRIIRTSVILIGLRRMSLICSSGKYDRIDFRGIFFKFTSNIVDVTSRDVLVVQFLLKLLELVVEDRLLIVGEYLLAIVRKHWYLNNDTIKCPLDE